MKFRLTLCSSVYVPEIFTKLEKIILLIYPYIFGRVDEDYKVKVADFGLSKEATIFVDTEGQKQMPFKWMALESMIEREYSEKSDVVRQIHTVIKFHGTLHRRDPENGIQFEKLITENIFKTHFNKWFLITFVPNEIIFFC